MCPVGWPTEYEILGDAEKHLTDGELSRARDVSCIRRECAISTVFNPFFAIIHIVAGR